MAEIKCAICGIALGAINDACPRCLPGFYGQAHLTDKLTRLEANAAASVALDAGDTQVEPICACCEGKGAMDDSGEACPGCNGSGIEDLVINYKAAVRDLADALVRAGLNAATFVQQAEIRLVLEKHAAAIAAAKED